MSCRRSHMKMWKLSQFYPCLFCNAMSSTVLAFLTHANSFLFTIWISIYTSATRIFENPCNMDVYIRSSLFVLQMDIIEKSRCLNVQTEQPKKYTSNNQTSIKIYFERMYKYIVGCWQNTGRTSLVSSMKTFLSHTKQ